jgi:hypothetical protein
VLRCEVLCSVSLSHTHTHTHTHTLSLMSALLAGDNKHIPSNYNCLPEATSIKSSAQFLHRKHIVSAYVSTECQHIIINIITFSFTVAIGDARVVDSVEGSERAELETLRISVRFRYKYVIERINKS